MVERLSSPEDNSFEKEKEREFVKTLERIGFVHRDFTRQGPFTKGTVELRSTYDEKNKWVQRPDITVTFESSDKGGWKIYSSGIKCSGADPQEALDLWIQEMKKRIALSESQNEEK